VPPTSLSSRSSRHSRRKFLQSSAAAASGLALSSCGWTLASVRSGTSQSRSDQVGIYTWANYADETLIEGFTTQTGIRVLPQDKFPDNETMLARVLTGGGAAYSVISPSDYMVKKMMQSKLLQKLDHSRLNGLDTLLERYRSPDYDPDNRHSIPISWGTTGLIYNPEKLPDGPKDWSYLWDNKEKLSKKMTLLSDVREVMGATLRMLGYSYNSTSPKELEQAYNKLKELKPYVATFTTDTWQDQIVSGDLWLAMGYSIDAFSVISSQPNLKYVIPKSGTSLWTDTMVIPTSSPNISGAYAWLNYLLQPSIAAQYKRLNIASPNQAVLDQLSSDYRESPILFPPEALIKASEGIALVGDFSKVYDDFWTRLTSGS